MTDLIEIQSDRIKTIRTGRKIGRPKLAKLLGLTERKLAKLETEKRATLPQAVVAKLSAVLDVPEATLTGEFTVTQNDVRPVEKSTCTSGCCG